MRLIGIDIGGTKTTVAEGTADGRVLSQKRFPTTDPDTTLAAIMAAVAALGPDQNTVIGIACGDPQDSPAGVILAPPNLPEWKQVAIGPALSERFGCPAYLMNDANAGALAEWQFGAARGSRNVIFLTAGTGMGAGLILNGLLHEGATRRAGEVGHIRLAPGGPVGYGKAGSFEGFCSGGGIAKLAQARAGEAGGAVSYNPGAIDDITARHVGEAALRGECDAQQLLADVGSYLGQALAILIDILNPETIVIGSLYVRCRAFLEESMCEAIASEALSDSAQACRIVPAELGEDLGALQAIAVALYRS
ncbi:MAG: ROK family protein [Lentisphaerae bacterium]|nr:ROK family protein [Lentisphaerota bacterium]